MLPVLLFVVAERGVRQPVESLVHVERVLHLEDINARIAEHLGQEDLHDYSGQPLGDSLRHLEINVQRLAVHVGQPLRIDLCQIVKVVELISTVYTRVYERNNRFDCNLPSRVVKQRFETTIFATVSKTSILGIDPSLNIVISFSCNKRTFRYRLPLVLILKNLSRCTNNSWIIDVQLRYSTIILLYIKFCINTFNECCRFIDV